MKHIFLLVVFLCLFVLQGCLKSENDVEKIINKIRKECLIEEDIKKISNLNDLRVIRNSIYAYHGYIFKSYDLKQFFSKYEWYHPLAANVDDKLTDADKLNISFVQNSEENLKQKILSSENNRNYEANMLNEDK